MFAQPEQRKNKQNMENHQRAAAKQSCCQQILKRLAMRVVENAVRKHYRIIEIRLKDAARTVYTLAKEAI